MFKSYEFKNKVKECAQEIGVVAREIHIRSMRRKWASCSSKGRLTFSSDLLNEPDDKQYEVIIHELLHLKYPNHGKVFKMMLKIYTDKLRKNSMVQI